jgi:hypothetical protein
LQVTGNPVEVRRRKGLVAVHVQIGRADIARFRQRPRPVIAQVADDHDGVQRRDGAVVVHVQRIGRVLPGGPSQGNVRSHHLPGFKCLDREPDLIWSSSDAMFSVPGQPQAAGDLFNPRAATNAHSKFLSVTMRFAEGQLRRWLSASG